MKEDGGEEQVTVGDDDKLFMNFIEHQRSKQSTMRAKWNGEIDNTIDGIKHTMKPIYPNIIPEIEGKLRGYLDYDFMFIGTGEQKRIMPILDKFMFMQVMDGSKDIPYEERLAHYDGRSKKIFEKFGMTPLWNTLEEHQEGT